MSSVLNFAANWNKWYRVLRYRKGFGPFDSLRFGLWLAQGQEETRPAQALSHHVRASA
jgi:hypothetical protein